MSNIVKFPSKNPKSILDDLVFDKTIGQKRLEQIIGELESNSPMHPNNMTDAEMEDILNDNYGSGKINIIDSLSIRKGDEKPSYQSINIKPIFEEDMDQYELFASILEDHIKKLIDLFEPTDNTNKFEDSNKTTGKLLEFKKKD